MSDDVSKAIAPNPPPADRATYSCDCGFNIVDDTGDAVGFYEAIHDHEETCAQHRQPPVTQLAAAVTAEPTDQQLHEALFERDARECALSDGQELHIAISFLQKAGLLKQYIVFRSGALEAIQ